MSEKSLFRTRLYDWHVARGARMVAFADWSMPVQYPTGVSREHVATRMSAGVFDICHMGRFRIAGANAATVLADQLTNDARVLEIGRAHYTFLANEHGGAVDDAFLYRLAAEEFLLVVNAANRARDRARIRAACIVRGVGFVDETEASGMVALQGPQAEVLLMRALGEGERPEARRNSLRIGTFRGAALISARTGYTGERVGFELFVPAQSIVPLWQALVDAGAAPVGLGARDSLRLEAGLPLHGHELGEGLDGRDIPIFAHRIARFGVRPAGRGRYLGVDALEAQRSEYEAILAERLQGEPQWLPRLVQPIASPAGRRPLRAGYQVFRNGVPVGYVTSGTSAPAAVPGEDGGLPPMRPIGLALIDASLRFRPDSPTQLEIRDARGAVMSAELVESNLPAA